MIIRIQCFHWMHETASNGLRNIQAINSSHNMKSPFHADTRFLFFLFMKLDFVHRGVSVCRLPGGVVSPNFALKIIHFRTRFQGIKKKDRRQDGEREIERESKETELWIAIWLILITQHVYQNLGTWTLPCSVRRLSLPTWHECILLCPPWARKRKAVPRSFLKGAGERRDESLKNLINGTPVI